MKKFSVHMLSAFGVVLLLVAAFGFVAVLYIGLTTPSRLGCGAWSPDPSYGECLREQRADGNRPILAGAMLLVLLTGGLGAGSIRSAARLRSTDTR